MYELINSGLPLHMEEETGIMIPDSMLEVGGYARKTIGQMKGLLADESGLDQHADEACYDVYRGIAFPKDVPLFAAHQYRYDITVVMDGQINGECRKTSGHYHGWAPGRGHTYAEVYEVLQGTALFVLQKSPDFDRPDPERMHVEDLILVTVPAGKTLLVPPDYGHCSINIGDGPLVFSNLAYVPCPVHYDPVRYYHGMGVYVKRSGNGITYEQNSRISSLPAVRFAAVKENPALGITQDVPVYRSFCEHPGRFDYLSTPEKCAKESMQMLVLQDSLVQPDGLSGR